MRYQLTWFAQLLLLVMGVACSKPGDSGREQAPVVVRVSPLDGCALRVPVASPPESAGHALAYDAARRVVLLLTGTGGPGVGDAVLYELDVASRVWSRVEASGPSPSSRFLPGFAFDVGTGKTVLFGGRIGSSPPRDVWEWDGCSWSDRTPATLPSSWPSGRWAPAMVYDWAVEQVILTTGVEAVDTPWESAMSDATVFEWDSAAGTFAARSPAGASPSNRGGAVAVADRERSLVYLTTGLRETDDFNSTGDPAVYVWDGSAGTWSARAPSSTPAARAFATGFYDPIADRVLLWGGLWYAWVWTPDAWQYSPASNAFSLVGTGDAFNRYWSPAVYDDASKIGIQYGGAGAGPSDGFAGISMHAFSDFADPFIPSQMGDTRQVTSAGSSSLTLESSGAPFSAFRTSAVTIDGVISPGEWDDASVQAFDACGGASPGLAYVKNDATDLYIAIVLDDVVWSPSSTLLVQFDNNGDGVVAPGDNQWLVRTGTGIAVDGFNPTGAPGVSGDDTAAGGTTDVVGAVTHSNPVSDGAGTYVVEFRGALNSADDAHDFSLAVGDLVGLSFLPIDVGTCTGAWPSTTPAQIRIAPPGAAPGAACSDTAACARGACVDGVCCTSA